MTNPQFQLTPGRATRNALPVLLIALIVLVSLALPGIAQAAVKPPQKAPDGITLTIGLDYSGSNPLISHPNFADEAAKHVHRAITSLSQGDLVRLQSFGSRQEADNLLRREIVISRRQRPATIAVQVAKFVQDMPKKGIKAQGSTNLLAWLELGREYGCDQGGQILVITDALESSKTVSAAALLAGTADLPPPRIALAGCTVTFFGLGANQENGSVHHLEDRWQHWMDQAGARFIAIKR